MFTERDRSLGSCRAWTSVIRVPVSVTRTCTGPYCVSITGPVIDRTAGAVVVDGASARTVDDVRMVEDVLVSCGGGAVDVEPGTDRSASGVLGLVWNPATRASPPAVVTMTGMARRMTLRDLSSRTARSGCVCGERRGRGAGGRRRRAWRGDRTGTRPAARYRARACATPGCRAGRCGRHRCRYPPECAGPLLAAWSASPARP